VTELARSGSFTKAAQALYITQPTLSKMVRKLEDELGVPLFARIGKRYELTDAGRVIASEAEKIIASFRNMQSELKDLTGFRKGTVRIGLPPMVGSSFFPRVMSRFRSKYPGLHIQMTEEGSKRVEEEVEAGRLDIGAVLLPVDEARFGSYVFVRETLKLVVPSAHPLASRSEAHLSELAGEPFVYFHRSFALYERVIDACRSVGFHPDIRIESSQWDFIQEMVAAGLGIALLPAPICRSLRPERVRVLSLVEPAIPWHLAIIWRKDGYMPLAAREWIRLAKELLEEA